MVAVAWSCFVFHAAEEKKKKVSAFYCSEIVLSGKAQIHDLPLILGSPLCLETAPSSKSIGICEYACWSQDDAEQKGGWNLLFLKNGDQKKKTFQVPVTEEFVSLHFQFSPFVSCEKKILKPASSLHLQQFDRSLALLSPRLGGLPSHLSEGHTEIGCKYP